MGSEVGGNDVTSSFKAMGQRGGTNGENGPDGKKRTPKGKKSRFSFKNGH